MKPLHLWSGVSAMLAAWSICASPARADTGLPAATMLVDCTADDGSHVGGTTSCAVDHSVANITTAPFVSLTASASYSAGAPANAGGFAVLNYNFAVVGGTKDTVVPVDIDTVLQQLAFNSGNSPAYGFAEIIVNTPRSSTSIAICTSGCGDTATSFIGTLQVDALAGESGGNTISLEIEALAGGYADIPSNSASAYADPRIYVDPGFANAGDYSIVLSDGVGNGIAAPVPEPASIALMLGGLAFIGCAVPPLRRRADDSIHFDPSTLGAEAERRRGRSGKNALCRSRCRLPPARSCPRPPATASAAASRSCLTNASSSSTARPPR